VKFLRPTHPYIEVQGRWCYLYRAVDRHGALADVRPSETRDMEAAKAFFRSAKVVTGVIAARVHHTHPMARSLTKPCWFDLTVGSAMKPAPRGGVH
jgi:hypothetical protein